MSFPLRFRVKSGENSGDSCRYACCRWLALDQTHLSKNARAAIDDARQNGDGLAISDIILLELATLSSKGRIRLDISLESFLREVEARFIIPTDQRPPCAPSDFQQLILRIRRIAL
jgi:hypothetical protein